MSSIKMHHVDLFSDKLVHSSVDDLASVVLGRQGPFDSHSSSELLFCLSLIFLAFGVEAPP